MGGEATKGLSQPTRSMTTAAHPSATPVGESSGAVRPSAPVRLPELLAPAGDWECARAAVENGADAIYFGLDRFNARMRARNFTEADLPALMEFLHRRGVRGYVTLNTLVFDAELDAVEAALVEHEPDVAGTERPGLGVGEQRLDRVVAARDAVRLGILTAATEIGRAHV